MHVSPTLSHHLLTGGYSDKEPKRAHKMGFTASTPPRNECEPEPYEHRLKRRLCLVVISLTTPMDLYLSGIHIMTDWLHILSLTPLAPVTCVHLVRPLRFIHNFALIVVTGFTTSRRNYYTPLFSWLLFISAYYLNYSTSIIFTRWYLLGSL